MNDSKQYAHQNYHPFCQIFFNCFSLIICLIHFSFSSHYSSNFFHNSLSFVTQNPNSQSSALCLQWHNIFLRIHQWINDWILRFIQFYSFLKNCKTSDKKFLQSFWIRARNFYNKTFLKFSFLSKLYKKLLFIWDLFFLWLCKKLRRLEFIIEVLIDFDFDFGIFMCDCHICAIILFKPNDNSLTTKTHWFASRLTIR